MVSSMRSGLGDILKESIKILSKNGKLFAFTALVYLLLNSIFYLLNLFSSDPFVQDLVIKFLALPSMKPGSPEYVNLFAGMRKDVCAFLVIQLAAFLVNFFVTGFAMTATISISSASYNAKSLSLKDLVSRFARPWERLTVTSFHITLLVLGYSSFLFMPFVIPIILLSDHSLALVAIFLVFCILLIVSFLNLYVVWVLALVVSVTEESRGLVALGRAAVISKGKRLQGFLLNLLFSAVVAVISLGFIDKVVSLRSPLWTLLQTCFICLVSMFQVIAYTVLYFQCTTSQSAAYSPVPKTPLHLADTV